MEEEKKLPDKWAEEKKPRDKPKSKLDTLADNTMFSRSSK